MPIPTHSVSLASGQVVLIDPQDHADLMSRGFTRAWFVVRSTAGFSVKTKDAAHKHHVVARLVLGPPDGEQVSYRNGNPLDLTRANLVLRSALRAPAQPKPLAAPKAKPRRPAIAPPATRPPQDRPAIEAVRQRAREVRRRAADLRKRVACHAQLTPELIASLTDKERAKLPDTYGEAITGRPRTATDAPRLDLLRAAANRRHPSDPDAARTLLQWMVGRRALSRADRDYRATLLEDEPGDSWDVEGTPA